MSAPRPALPPADQVASSLEQGRKLILQLVCGGYLLYLLAHRLLTDLLLPPLGPELMTGYIAAASLLLSMLPTIRFRLLTLLLAAGFLPYVAYELMVSLRLQVPPLGYLSWMPLVVVLCFSVLGWRLGAAGSSLLVLSLFLGLRMVHIGTPEQINGWLAEGGMLVVMVLVCALIARFVEDRLLVGHEASVQLAAARMDTLTGLLGRAASELYLSEGLELVRQERLPLSLLICDLDNFKSVNDRYGHPVGDAVLKAAARRLRRQVGGSGQVGRWGGEEFVVILPSVAKTDALVLAERLRKALAGQELAGLPVTASFGVASYRPGDTLDQLFTRADEALYEAKNGGRNLVRG